MKLILVLILSFSTLLSKEITCITQWIEESNTKYTPPKAFETIYIEFVGKNIDKLKFRTQNNTSIYEYSSFIDINDNLGISFKAYNGNIIDVFQNGDLYIWKNKNSSLKAKCKNINFEITK